nr:hypothetical protein [Tanacetum cinerariifolium]
MAQQIIHAYQLVLVFQSTGRCNNYDVLHNIPCSPECKIYPRFTKLIIVDLMKKFDSIPQRLKEEYHSIKDYIFLVSVYTAGNMTVKGMLILVEFITDEIHATKEYKEYVNVFVKKKRKQVADEISSPRKSLKVTIKQKKTITTLIPPPSDDRERDEIAEATLLSLTLHKTAIAAEAQENVTKVQEKLEDVMISFYCKLKSQERGILLQSQVWGKSYEKNYSSVRRCIADPVNVSPNDLKSKTTEDIISIGSFVEVLVLNQYVIVRKNIEEEIAKMVEGDEDEESYESGFVDSMLNNDDDFGTRIEPGSHKKHLENVVDDDETEKEKKDDKKGDEKENDDEKKDKTGSIETRKEKIRRGLIRTHLKSTFVTDKFFMGNIREVLDHCNNIMPKLTFAKTNEMLKEEIPRLVNLVVNRDKEIAPTNVLEDDAFRPQHHDDHQEDDAPPEGGEKGKKTQDIKEFKIYKKLFIKATSKRFVLSLLEQESEYLVNFTAPTLIYPSIEARDPYFIIDKPNTRLIYLNSKEEKRVMYLAEIIKFYDATLERVLKEVKLKIFKSEPWKKPPPLGELDLDTMKAYERNNQASKTPCADETVGIVREWKTNSTRNEYCTTPIVEGIDKIKRKIINGKLTLVDDDVNSLPKVVNADSDSEVEDVTRDDDYDPYDDDLYEIHDMFETLSSICDDLDITVRGRKKK